MNPELAAWFSLTMHMTGLLSPPSAASHFLLGGLILQLQETLRACLLLLTFPKDSSGGESLCRFISSSEGIFQSALHLLLSSVLILPKV